MPAPHAVNTKYHNKEQHSFLLNNSAKLTILILILSLAISIISIFPIPFIAMSIMHLLYVGLYIALVVASYNLMPGLLDKIGAIEQRNNILANLWRLGIVIGAIFSIVTTILLFIGLPLPAFTLVILPALSLVTFLGAYIFAKHEVSNKMELLAEDVDISVNSYQDDIFSVEPECIFKKEVNSRDIVAFVHAINGKGDASSLAKLSKLLLGPQNEESSINSITICVIAHEKDQDNLKKLIVDILGAFADKVDINFFSNEKGILFAKRESLSACSGILIHQTLHNFSSDFIDDLAELRKPIIANSEYNYIPKKRLFIATINTGLGDGCEGIFTDDEIDDDNSLLDIQEEDSSLMGLLLVENHNDEAQYYWTLDNQKLSN